MRKLISIFLIVVGLSTFIPTNSRSGINYLIGGAKKAFASAGGPIVLDGMDPVCHSVYGENTYQYIGKVIKSVYDQSSMPGNSGKIAILGTSGATNAGGCGGNWSTLLSTKFMTQFTTAPATEFISSTTDLDTFFSTTITSAPPRIIWIPDDWARSGAVSSIFTTNAEKIADFVNSGGGIFANVNTYGWLTALLPSAVFNNGGCNGGPEATADGIADFGLSNTIVAACWHGYFTGNVGTLKTLVDYPYPSSGSTRKAVAIGGGSVSLPSSFTLGVSPENPNAGEDIVITATAQTISGIPQAGVTVTVTVSAGPDAGQTFTATTNSSGIATITIRTNSTGSATYTATATVNGVAKTVSATVVWNPPTTTTAAPTTTTTSTTSTTIASTTTQMPIPSTTAVVIIPQTSLLPTTSLPPETTTTQAIIVPTTIHDHSTHSHGSLAQTGIKPFAWIYGFIMIFVGLLIMIGTKKSRQKA